MPLNPSTRSFQSLKAQVFDSCNTFIFTELNPCLPAANPHSITLGVSFRNVSEVALLLHNPLLHAGVFEDLWENTQATHPQSF